MTTWPKGAVFVDAEGRYYDDKAEPLACPTTDAEVPCAEVPINLRCGQCPVTQEVGTSAFLTVPVLEGFDEKNPIGELRILKTALPPLPGFCFSLGIKALDAIPRARYVGRYELCAVSITTDEAYARYLQQVGVVPDRAQFVQDAKLAIVGAAAKLIDEFSGSMDRINRGDA